MASILKVDQLQKPDGSTPTAADLGIDVAGTVLQMATVIDQSEGLKINHTSSSLAEYDLKSFNFTPKSSTSKTVIICNVFMGYSPHSGNTGADQDNKWLMLYNGSTKLIGKNSSDSYMYNGFYGTDVPIQNSSNPYYARYDGTWFIGAYEDTSARTAGTPVTYTLKGGMSGTDAWINYNRVHNRAGDGGVSSYLIYEIAQ